MTQSKQVSVIGQICQSIDKMQESLDESLQGTGISINRYLATAKTAIQTHPQKDKLEQADRQSLYLAIKRSAGDGLMPDGREAALVVYNNKKRDASGKETWVSEVQYQPMVQGLVKLARNSGEIESINSEVVYENDEFELYYDFDGTKFKHAPNWQGDRGLPVLVWAAIRLKSGEIIARAYPKDRIMQISSRSKMAVNYDPQKGKDWEEFWRKAAIRNILKYAPRTTAIDKALEENDKEFTFDDDSPAETPKKSVAEKPKKRETKASQTVKESAPVIDAEPESEPEVIDAEPVIESEPDLSDEDEIDVPI